MIFFVLLVVLVVIVLVFALVGGDYQLKRIAHFQRRRLKGSRIPSMIPLIGEAQQPKQTVRLTDVRDLIISLQLGTSMEATLTGSISRAAEQFADRGILGERLGRHVEAKLGSVGPQAVLEGLVQDFDCPQLAEVLERVRMAEDGGVSYNQVLAVSVAAIEEDIRSQIERDIQKAPTRLTLPMVIGVFFPALVLGLLPLLGSALTQMRAP